MTRRRGDRRVVVALGAALVAGAVLIVVGGDGGGGGDASGQGTTTSATPASGDLDVDVPDGWQAVPLPSLGFGLALPPEWQATRTNDAALDVLESRNLEDPGFIASARNAAAAGAVLYAARQDGDGRVSDVKVQVLPRAGTTTAAELRELADRLVEEASLRDALITEGDAAGKPAVTIRFSTSGAGVTARGTQVLRAGDDGVVSLIVTSEREDADALADAISATLTLG